MTKLPVALQLYTVRDLTAQDFVGTVRKVAALGYPAIETAWPFEIPARDLKALLDELGLEVVGAHVALDNLENNLLAALDDLRHVGARYVICPWIDKDRRRDAEDWRRLATLLDRAGEGVTAAGLTFCYHNHDFEFTRLDGEAALDRLYDWTDPKLVQAELDVYWVKYAGADPVEYIEKLTGRVPLVHMKDMDPSDRSFAEVGEGTLDMPAVIRAARAAGSSWFVVEQDICKRPSLESARISLENLTRMLQA
jgi:sugar phosphate isomerase/epimerase